jgi:DNA-binding IclR family transcriptional regulator
MRKGNSTVREQIPDEEAIVGGVRSVFRTVDILNCLNNNINALTDIAENCGLSDSIAHRLLKTLEKTNLVTQDTATRRYYLGPLIAQLSSNPQTTHQQLMMCAQEEMNRLATVSGETVGICVLVGARLIRLYNIPSQSSLRVWEEGINLGQPFIGAPAKVLLSQLKDDDIKILLDNVKLKPLTEKSITNKEALRKQLVKIRQQGYAISYGERVQGATGISAPIKSYIYPAELSIAAPEIRVRPKLDSFLKELLISAGRISDKYQNIVQH